jgi:hypothetical protein
VNYYAAREISDTNGAGTGRWRYTVRNGKSVRAIGSCADGCPGHATAAEACEHYRVHLIANASWRSKPEGQWPKEKCDVADCQREARHVADLPGRLLSYQFCDLHAQRDTLAGFVEVGESVSSY